MDTREVFKKPKVYIWLPCGPFKHAKTWDYETNRDFLVHGERLQFYLVVSFAKMVESGPLTIPPSRSTTDIQSSPMSLQQPATFSPPQSPMAFGSVEPTNVPVLSPQYTSRVKDLFTNLKLQVQFQHVRSNLPLSHEKHSNIAGYSNFTEASPSPLLSAPAYHDPLNRQKSSLENGGASDDIRALDRYITLDNGDIAYPLQTIVAPSSEYVNDRVNLVVIMQPQETKSSVEDLLSTLSFHEKSPPQRYIGRQTTLMDPISVTFSTRKVYDRYFVTVSVENLHGEPCVVSGLDVHLGPSDLNGTIVDYHKLLKVEIPQTVSANRPTVLMPREQTSFVLEFQSLALPPHIAALIGGQLHPLMMLTWSTPSLSSWIHSQYKLSIPYHKAEDIIVSVKVKPNETNLASSSPDALIAKVNTEFQLEITVANLGHIPKDLSLELPLPGQTQRFRQPSVLPDAGTSLVEEEQQRLKQARLDTWEAQQGQAVVYYYERSCEIGRLEAQSESTVTIRCLPLASGLFKLSSIRIVDKASQFVPVHYELSPSPEILVI